MNCAQCQGIEEVFSEPLVKKELQEYQKKGPDKTTRMLVEAVEKEGVDGLTLLDIGGGVGAVQHELLRAGAARVTDVDASSAYLQAAKSEAQRRGYADRANYLHGNFVELAKDVAPADIVTLDRVICCYPDMEQLVSLSAERARRRFGAVYPRDTWWIRLGLAVGNFFLRLRRNPFRGYVHPTEAVEAILSRYGFKRYYYRKTLIWQVAAYVRDGTGEGTPG